MSLEQMKKQAFPDYTYEDWKQKAEESLKGKSIQSLSRNTYENIPLKPLYTKEDVKIEKNTVFPGAPDYRRGIEPLGYVKEPWKVAQTIQYTQLDELAEKLTSSLEKGQSALAFEVKKDLFTSATGFESLLENTYEKYPFSIDARGLQPNFLARLITLVEKNDNGEKATGVIGADPLALLVECGGLPSALDAYYDEWAETISKANDVLPNVKTILVNTTPYHNGGANAIQELAIALATGVYHIEQLTKRGLSLETIISKMVFRFSVGANFFMELAKLRAARLLWNKVTEAYGLKAEHRTMVISAETSYLTKTIYDPYVNLLRSGNEAFAAVLGGVQYLHVHRFDEAQGQSSAFSERIARNTQLILQEETHVKHVVDPAGGSWYVESLTNELAEKAWEFFLQIDEKGSIYEALKSGWLQGEIEQVYKARELDVFTRKKTIIGTNVYANLSDQYVAVESCEKTTFSTAKVSDLIHEILSGNNPLAFTEEVQNDVPVIVHKRLAQAYEELRHRSEQLQKKTGKIPAIGLICLGELKKHKARADFISGFIGAGGLQAERSGPIDHFEAADTFVNETNCLHYCICGTNEQYEEEGLKLLQELKAKHPHLRIYVAGLVDKEQQPAWTEAGVEQFIHVKSNCYETVASLLDDLEVGNHGE